MLAPVRETEIKRKRGNEGERGGRRETEREREREGNREFGIDIKTNQAYHVPCDQKQNVFMVLTN